MTAALHYSTAWSVPALFAVTIWLLIPLGRIGMISKWGWPPARSSLEFLAGLVGTITFVCWWFWLLRLGSAAPADTRTRVAWFFGLGAPVMVAGGAAAWWFGLGYGLTHLFDSWKLGF